MTASLARYVRDCDVEDYEALGWLTRTYHGQRGEHDVFVMVWPCECRSIEPLTVTSNTAQGSSRCD